MEREIEVVLQVRSYIGHPYWIETEQVVSIQKKSRMNAMRSEQKREQALRGYLEQEGMTMAEYEAVVRKASEEFYRDASGCIFIPSLHLTGCLVQACKGAPAKSRMDGEQLRSLVQVSDFVTDRKEHTRVWERFCVPKDPRGKPLSNQRGLRRNQVLESFDARGTLTINDDDVKPAQLRGLLDYAGKYTGVGAARKMGFGRFTVKRFSNGD